MKLSTLNLLCLLKFKIYSLTLFSELKNSETPAILAVEAVPQMIHANFVFVNVGNSEPTDFLPGNSNE